MPAGALKKGSTVLDAQLQTPLTVSSVSPPFEVSELILLEAPTVAPTAAPTAAPTEAPTQAPCCMAMTADCLSCKDGITKREYCEKHPDTTGCPKACCKALTAKCIACSEGKTKDEVCKKKPGLPGCPKKAPETCKSNKKCKSPEMCLPTKAQGSSSSYPALSGRSGGVKAGFCAGSPKQLCRMKCPGVKCKSKDHCAMREGICCDLKCQKEQEYQCARPKCEEPNWRKQFVDKGCSKGSVTRTVAKRCLEVLNPWLDCIGPIAGAEWLGRQRTLMAAAAVKIQVSKPTITRPPAKPAKKPTGKTPAKKPSVKKPTGKAPVKKPTIKRPTIKKPTIKKPAAKKPVAKKPVAKKPVAKKPVAKKPVAKKPKAKKPTVKSPVAKPAKKPAPKKQVVKKPKEKKTVKKKKPAPKKKKTTSKKGKKSKGRLLLEDLMYV